MSTARLVDGIRGESTSPGLSSPPSPNSPTRQTAPPIGHPHPNAASLPPNAQIDGNDGGVKSAKSSGAKTAAASLRKSRKKKEPESKSLSNNSQNNNHVNDSNNNNNKTNHNGNVSTATDGHDQKSKKTRAARGTSDHFKKRQQKLEQQTGRDSEELQVSRQL